MIRVGTWSINKHKSDSKDLIKELCSVIMPASILARHCAKGLNP